MELYTMDAWKRDKSFKAVAGQEIEKSIYEEMLNVLPPLTLPREKARQILRDHHIPIHAGFLMGEPYDSDDKGVLYMAFGSNDYGNGTHYFYLGLSHEQEKLDGVYYSFACMNWLVNDGLFKESEFKDVQEAIDFASNYEAVLHRHVFSSGVLTSTETLYDPWDIFNHDDQEESEG